MKIILSRKGFDSSSGGMPSPILPDGKIVSLPIPCEKSPSQLKSLNWQGKRLSKIVNELSRGRVNSKQYLHLDPDIDYSILKNRPDHWRGAFGQMGAAQKHLANEGVSPGDLFLFFGWFKQVERHKKLWRFKPNAPDLHIIYGWLLVQEIVSVYQQETTIVEQFPWLSRHPHLNGSDNPNNSIYIADSKLPDSIAEQAGFGVFDSVKPAQILTDTSQSKRSVWKLPVDFYPHDGKPALSYHHDLTRWKILDNKWLNLQSVARGQEFVLDCDYYPEVLNWLRNLLI